MAETSPNTERIRIFDVQDRLFTLRVFTYSAFVSLGLTLIAMALSFRLAADSVPVELRGLMLFFTTEYLIIGIAAFFAGLGLGMRERWIIRKSQGVRRHLSHNPKVNDKFVVIIEGLGSHGNPERDGYADNIVELAIRDIIANGGIIETARFYSSSGVRNLLKRQL